MDFKWISAGELAEGQYITVLGLKPVKKEIMLPTGEIHQILEEDKNPFIKGVPYKVINVKLPLIMVENICKVPNLPPAVIYDTRLVEFLEVDQDYSDKYREIMFPQQVKQAANVSAPPTPPETVPFGSMEIPDEGAEYIEEQGNFDFGSDEPPSSPCKGSLIQAQGINLLAR